MTLFKPLHHYFDLDKKNFRKAEEAYDKALSIPIYPALKDDEVDYIIDNVVNL